MANKLAYDQVENMRSLGANWDSYGAKPIDKRNIDTALILLETLPGPAFWSAVPCSDGGVQLEYHRNGCDIEIRVTHEPRQGTETRTDLWDAHGNSGMRHMENADVSGGATDMVGRCIHGTKHTDGDGCPHCPR